MLIKTSIYIFLILIYLGLSKVSEDSIYIKNEGYYNTYFPPLVDTPSSLILTSQSKRGFFIKTYFQSYLYIKSYHSAETVMARTSKAYYKKCKNYLGLSLFRTSLTLGRSTSPSTPGILFVGDTNLGEWGYLDSGIKIWIFYKTYDAYFRQILNLGDYYFTYDHYQKAKLAQENNEPFFGPEREFDPIIDSQLDPPKQSNDDSKKKEPFYQKYLNFPPLTRDYNNA